MYANYKWNRWFNIGKSPSAMRHKCSEESACPGIFLESLRGTQKRRKKMDAGSCGAMMLRYRESIASSSLGGDSGKWIISDVPTDSTNMNLSKLLGTVEDREGWWAAVREFTVRHDLATEQHLPSLLCSDHLSPQLTDHHSFRANSPLVSRPQTPEKAFLWDEDSSQERWGGV